MKKLLIILAVVIMSNNIYSQLDRSKAPAPKQAPEIKFGEVYSFELKNGLKVFVVENFKQPTISINLIIDRDPIVEGDKAGYLEAVGDLLRGGTKKRTKDQLDEEIDFIGATFETSSTEIYASVLSRHKEKLFDIFADVVLNSDFKQEELDKFKLQKKSSLQSQKDDPKAIVNRVRKKLYFGEGHPYSESAKEETVDNIDLKVCVDYYKKYFIPNISYLAIVGPIKKKDAERLVKKYFDDWKKGTIEKKEYKFPELPSVPKVAIVNRDNSVQSVINVGHPINLKIGSPDAIKATVANTMLGGGVFRLFQNLREKHSFTYGAYSTLVPDMAAGHFTASTEVRNSATDSAISEILYEMKRMRNEEASDDEVSLVKNYRMGNFALSLENPQTIANFAINIARYKLPKDYYKNYMKEIQSVTAKDIMEVSKKYILPDNCYIIVVGKGSEISEGLKKFNPGGKIEYYDIYGNKYDPSLSSLPVGLTPEKVIEEFQNVCGGKEKLKSLKSYSIEYKGTIQGQELAVKMIRTNDGKFYQETLINNNSVQTLIINGDKGIITSMQGKKELTKDEISEYLIMSDFFNMHDYKKENIVLNIIGVDKIDGLENVKIEYSKGNKKWIEYYNLKTKFKTQVSSLVETPMGQSEKVSKYAEYKEKDGYIFPHRLIQNVMGQSLSFEVSSIQVNAEPNKALFEIK